MKKVFLGGTCNESKWRDDLIVQLDPSVIDYYNPVVDDWTPECQEEEIKQREECYYVLYVITPKITGVYSIAEVVDDSNKKPEKTLFCILEIDENKIFDKGQLKSLSSVSKMVSNNGGKVFKSLNDIAKFLNNNKYIKYLQ